MKRPELDTQTPFGSRPANLADLLAWGLATWWWFPASIKRRLRRWVRGRAGPFDIRVSHTLTNSRYGFWQRPFGTDLADPTTMPATLAFRVYPSENYCDRILIGRSRLPEAREQTELLPYLTHGMVFIDIGANVGAYSVPMGSRGVGARILAFEPHPRTAAKLRYNLAANDIDADVIEAAVGDAPGTMQLWSDGGGNIGQTSLLPEATSNAKVAVDVEIVPLADALAQRDVQHIDLLKIDVEGFEDRALSGFLASSPKSGEPDLRPRAILLEEEHSHLWQVDLRALLAGLNYQAVFRTHQNVLYVRQT